MSQRRALGKGLDALLPSGPKASGKKEVAVELRLNEIQPNKSQPRERITPEELNELIKSVKEEGVIEPIVVAEIGPDKYEIIAGERRYTAAERAGLKTIPARVLKNLTPLDRFRLALVENIHRQDLNPIEEAKGYKALMDGYDWTQEEVADKLGKNRVTVANAVRLLKLSDEIQGYIKEKKIQPGHGKVLLGVDDKGKQRSLCEQAIINGWSVRDLEKAVSKSGAKAAKPKKGQDPELRAVEDRMKHIFGTKVTVKGTYKKGKIEIEYYNKEIFEGILEKLKIKI